MIFTSIILQLGPNVSIGPNAVLGAGVRIRESIVLADAQIQAHSVVLHSIVGRSSIVGEWARVEGTPCDPNPNKPFAKMENPPLFNANGKLNPSITILGKEMFQRDRLKNFEDMCNTLSATYPVLSW